MAYTHTSILIHSVSPRILSSVCPCSTESRYKKKCRKNLPYHIRPHIYLFLYLASGSDQFLTLHRKVGGKSNKRKIYFLQACFRYSFPVITVFYNLLFLWSFIFPAPLTPATSYPISDLNYCKCHLGILWNILTTLQFIIHLSFLLRITSIEKFIVFLGIKF